VMQAVGVVVGHGWARYLRAAEGRMGGSI